MTAGRPVTSFIPQRQQLSVAEPDAAAGRRLELKAVLPGRVRRHTDDPLFSTSYLLLIAAAGASGLGFIFWVAAARLYTPMELGRAGVLISAATISLRLLIIPALRQQKGGSWAS